MFLFFKYFLFYLNFYSLIFHPTQPRNVVPCVHVRSHTIRGVYHGRDSHVEKQEHSLFSP